MSNDTLRCLYNTKRENKHKHTTAGSERYRYDSFVLKCIVRYDKICLTFGKPASHRAVMWLTLVQYC